MIPALCVSQPSFIPTTNTMYATLQSLGLTSGLQTCLDASDAASYSGSGQTWTDETGNGYSFFRGNSGSVEAADPTFNGTAGSQTSATYWSVNGSQWFTLNQTNPAWVQQMHKSGGIFTILEWVYINNQTSISQFFGSVGDDNSSGASGVGVFFGSSTATLRKTEVEISNGPSSNAYLKESSGSLNNSAWNLMAVSCNMVTGVVLLQLNGATETYSGQSLSSPSSAAAEGTLQIGAVGGGSFPDMSGTRYSGVAIWNVALTATQLASIFSATRAKFGV